ncbi:MAG: hypothetical protein AB7H97_11570 [Pseudobdellovibrionaceae bacterium]
MAALKYIVLFSMFSITALLHIVPDEAEVVIESKESKTVSVGAVFNKIKWFRFKDQDVWMMNQSHFGLYSPAASWDRLAIVIDKTKSPKTAEFYQLEPGPLEWIEGMETSSLKLKPYKVACYMCHSNGPRAIRPNYGSPFDPTSLKDKLKIFYWNLRIKTYGRVLGHGADSNPDSKHPFRWSGDYENEALTVPTCVKCHKEEGFLARGRLRRQNLPTIKAMLEMGEMPPAGFSLSEKEKIQLESFLMGF